MKLLGNRHRLGGKIKFIVYNNRVMNLLLKVHQESTFPLINWKLKILLK